MTVGDLITILSHMDPEAEACIKLEDDGLEFAITDIEVIAEKNMVVIISD